MKCLDKKRIKMKQGETLALNERIMLSLVSTGVCFHHYLFFSLPMFLMTSLRRKVVHLLSVWRMHFIRQIKLCFILDLMNGK